ncbi:hypothetical protein PFISCL1PPCAC_11881, partial [Pristionchus fissidentatus]
SASSVASDDSHARSPPDFEPYRSQDEDFHLCYYILKAEMAHEALLAKSHLGIGIFIFYAVFVGQLTTLVYHWPLEVAVVTMVVSAALILLFSCLVCCEACCRMMNDGEVRELKD